MAFLGGAHYPRLPYHRFQEWVVMMSDLCSVCGKGETESYWSPDRHDPVAEVPVSHLACAEGLKGELELWQQMYREMRASHEGLRKDNDELQRQQKMHFLDVKDWQYQLYALENKLASLQGEGNFWKVMADKNEKFFDGEAERVTELENLLHESQQEQREIAELLTRIAAALGHPADDPLRLAETRMDELAELDDTLTTVIIERDELRKMLREACPVEPQCNCVLCSEEREYWMSSLRNHCKEYE